MNPINDNLQEVRPVVQSPENTPAEKTSLNTTEPTVVTIDSGTYKINHKGRVYDSNGTLVLDIATQNKVK